MDIQSVGGIIGVLCLGFASLAAYMMVPTRELTIRERIGIHTFYWSFAIYSMWTIYAISSEQGGVRLFYACIPLLLGLVLSLLSEFQSKQPPVNITDTRLKKITLEIWQRLPINAKRGLQNTIMNIQEIDEWSDLDKAYFKNKGGNAARWFTILPLPARGIIHISHSDCKDLADTVIIGSLVHEFGQAYQSTRTPFDTNIVEAAGTIFPIKWNFKKEIEAFNSQTVNA